MRRQPDTLTVDEQGWRAVDAKLHASLGFLLDATDILVGVQTPVERALVKGHCRGKLLQVLRTEGTAIFAVLRRIQRVVIVPEAG